MNTSSGNYLPTLWYGQGHQDQLAFNNQVASASWGVPVPYSWPPRSYGQDQHAHLTSHAASPVPYLWAPRSYGQDQHAHLTSHAASASAAPDTNMSTIHQPLIHQPLLGELGLLGGQTFKRGHEEAIESRDSSSDEEVDASKCSDGGDQEESYADHFGDFADESDADQSPADGDASPAEKSNDCTDNDYDSAWSRFPDKSVYKEELFKNGVYQPHVEQTGLRSSKGVSIVVSGDPDKMRSPEEVRATLEACNCRFGPGEGDVCIGRCRVPAGMPVGPWHSPKDAKVGMEKDSLLRWASGQGFGLISGRGGSKYHHVGGDHKHGHRVNILCSCSGNSTAATACVEDIRPGMKCNCKYELQLEQTKNGYYMGKLRCKDHNHALAKSVHEANANPSMRGIPDVIQAFMHTQMKVMGWISPAEIFSGTRLYAKDKGIDVTWVVKDIANYVASTRPSYTLDATGLIKHLQTRKSDSGFDFRYDTDPDGGLRNVLFEVEGGHATWKEGNGAILFVDTAHGTNIVGLKIAIMSTMDEEGRTRVVAVSLVKGDTHENFLIVFSWFLEIYDTAPSVLVTDEDQAMATAMAAVFINCMHVLCAWHLSENLKKNSRGFFIGANDLWQRYVSKWWQICKNTDCHSQSDFSTEWQQLHAILDERLKANSGLFGSYEKAKAHLARMKNVKEKWCCRWTWGYLHYGTLTSGRSEALHAVLKKILSGRVSLVRLVDTVIGMVEDVEERAISTGVKHAWRALRGSAWETPFMQAMQEQQKYSRYALLQLATQQQLSHNYLVFETTERRDGDVVYEVVRASPVARIAPAESIGPMVAGTGSELFNRDTAVAASKAIVDSQERGMTDCPGRDGSTVARHKTTRNYCSCQYTECMGKLICRHAFAVLARLQLHCQAVVLPPHWLIRSNKNFEMGSLMQKALALVPVVGPDDLRQDLAMLAPGVGERASTRLLGSTVDERRQELEKYITLVAQLASQKSNDTARAIRTFQDLIRSMAHHGSEVDIVGGDSLGACQPEANTAFVGNPNLPRGRDFRRHKSWWETHCANGKRAPKRRKCLGASGDASEVNKGRGRDGVAAVASRPSKDRVFTMPSITMDLSAANNTVLQGESQVRVWIPLPSPTSDTRPEDLPQRSELWHRARCAPPPSGCQWSLKRLVTASQVFCIALEETVKIADAELMRSYHKGEMDTLPAVQETRAMRWGNLCERNGMCTAVRHFTVGKGKQDMYVDQVVRLQETGLWHSEGMPGFAASPDALLCVLGDDGKFIKEAVIEIKCPYLHPFKDVGMEVEADEDNCDVLKKYWLMQVVFQMKVVGVETGHVVRWAPGKSHVFTVDIDDVEDSHVWSNFIDYFTEMWMGEGTLGAKPRGKGVYKKFKESLAKLHATVAESMEEVESVAHVGASFTFEG